MLTLTYCLCYFTGGLLNLIFSWLDPKDMEAYLWLPLWFRILMTILFLLLWPIVFLGLVIEKLIGVCRGS